MPKTLVHHLPPVSTPSDAVLQTQHVTGVAVGTKHCENAWPEQPYESCQCLELSVKSHFYNNHTQTKKSLSRHDIMQAQSKMCQLSLRYTLYLFFFACQLLRNKLCLWKFPVCILHGNLIKARTRLNVRRVGIGSTHLTIDFRIRAVLAARKGRKSHK